MGVELSNAGYFGPGFTGPLSLVLLVGFRVCQGLRNKYQKGKFINRKTSNWFAKETGLFQFENLWPLAGNFIPNLLGLIILSLGMKYATMGGVNQGVIPTLMSLGGVYSGILFYFAFNEIISVAQVFGMVLMMICVVLLGFESTEAAKRFVPTGELASLPGQSNLQMLYEQLGKTDT